MKLEISVNFDFGKLAGKTKNIIDDYTAGYAQDSEQASKDNIDAGLSPDIKQSTKKHRQRKGYPTRPPLKASGKMYNIVNVHLCTGFKDDNGLPKPMYQTMVIANSSGSKFASKIEVDKITPQSRVNSWK